MILDSFLRGLHSDRKLDLSALYSLPTDKKDLNQSITSCHSKQVKHKREFEVDEVSSISEEAIQQDKYSQTDEITRVKNRVLARI